MYSKFYIPIHIYTVLQNVAGKLFFDPKRNQLKVHREIWKRFLLTNLGLTFKIIHLEKS